MENPRIAGDGGPTLPSSDGGQPRTRTEPFMALTEEGDRLRGVIIDKTLEVYRRAAGVGAAPNWRTLERLPNPQVGDLVLELTRSSWARDPRMRRIGFGYLVYAQGEHFQVQYGPNPGDICDWENCSFIRVPNEALAGRR